MFFRVQGNQRASVLFQTAVEIKSLLLLRPHSLKTESANIKQMYIFQIDLGTLLH